MLLVIASSGWTYHPVVQRDTSTLVVGLTHDLSGNFATNSSNYKKGVKYASIKYLFDFLSPALPPPLQSLAVAKAGAMLFQQCWKTSFRGVTFCALNETTPWLFMVVDYPFLVALDRGKRFPRSVYNAVMFAYYTAR
jgi:hypothetical protein